MYRTVGVRCRKIIPSKQMKNITIYRYAGRAAELDLETVRSDRSDLGGGKAVHVVVERERNLEVRGGSRGQAQAASHGVCAVHIRAAGAQAQRSTSSAGAAARRRAGPGQSGKTRRATYGAES